MESILISAVGRVAQAIVRSTLGLGLLAVPRRSSGKNRIWHGHLCHWTIQRSLYDFPARVSKKATSTLGHTQNNLTSAVLAALPSIHV